MRWVSVALRVTNTHCFPSCWVECPSVSDPEAVQTRRTCQCTYCKDVYVGLLCLRVIYLHKDHDVTLEISGEIYLKYVAFCLSLWRSLRLRTNTGSFLFFFSFFVLPVQYYRSDPHSQAGAASQQDHKLEAVHTHYTCSSHLEKTLCIWATVDLCCLFTPSTTAEHFIGLTAPIFQTAVFYKTFEILTGDCFFSQRVHERVKTPIRKQLYLTSCRMSSRQIGTT